MMLQEKLDQTRTVWRASLDPANREVLLHTVERLRMLQLPSTVWPSVTCWRAPQSVGCN